jgi:hypothetical protein
MRNKAYNSPEKNGMFVIADTALGIAKAYNKSVQIEPGYEYTIEYTDILQTAVPQEFTEGFQQYLAVQGLLSNSNVLWTAIPRHLSTSGSSSAKPKKASKSEDVSDLGNSIHLLFGDAATSTLLQQAISSRLQLKYLTGSSFSNGVKHSFKKLAGLKPLTITVIFPDGSIDFTIFGGAFSSRAFAMVADTAIDKDGKPINKSAPSVISYPPNSIGHGFYASSGEYIGGYRRMNCKSTFTRTGSGYWTKTLSCNFSY